jgi:hypothetical protein
MIGQGSTTLTCTRYDGTEHLATRTLCKRTKQHVPTPSTRMNRTYMDTHNRAVVAFTAARACRDSISIAV